MSFQLTVSMKGFSCARCGCTYAVPDALQNYECPSCISREKFRLIGERDAARADVAVLERRVAHLKGSITKAKKRHLKVA